MRSGAKPACANNASISGNSRASTLQISRAEKYITRNIKPCQNLLSRRR